MSLTKKIVLTVCYIYKPISKLYSRSQKMAQMLFIKSKIQLKNTPGDSISIKFSNKLVIISQFIAQEKKLRTSGSIKQRSLCCFFGQKIFGVVFAIFSNFFTNGHVTSSNPAWPHFVLPKLWTMSDIKT